MQNGSSRALRSFGVLSPRFTPLYLSNIKNSPLNCSVGNHSSSGVSSGLTTIVPLQSLGHLTRLLRRSSTEREILGTSWVFRDLLDTRYRKLIVYGAYVPPLFSFLTPARHDHTPYRVR